MSSAAELRYYPIPDLTFIAHGRESIIASDGIRGGPPDAVIEICSPDDETYEKMPFFAVLGVPEVIVIDRDTKRPEIHRLAGPEYVMLQADRGGWVSSEQMDVRLTRAAESGRPLLLGEDNRDLSKRREI